MKLNNKGWGLSFLLVVGTIFLLILIFVSIRINSMTKKHNQNRKLQEEIVDSSKSSNPLYSALETQVENAGKSYVVYHSTLVENSSDHIIVSKNKLIEEGFISDLSDPDGNGTCDAYSKAVDGVTYYKKYDVLGADIRGNVYGGGNNAEVTGNTNVQIGQKK
jgi:hypothetical protein